MRARSRASSLTATRSQARARHRTSPRASRSLLLTSPRPPAFRPMRRGVRFAAHLVALARSAYSTLLLLSRHWVSFALSSHRKSTHSPPCFLHQFSSSSPTFLPTTSAPPPEGPAACIWGSECVGRWNEMSVLGCYCSLPVFPHARSNTSYGPCPMCLLRRLPGGGRTGECVCLVGRTGSNKTTTMRAHGAYAGPRGHVVVEMARHHASRSLTRSPGSASASSPRPAIFADLNRL